LLLCRLIEAGFSSGWIHGFGTANALTLHEVGLLVATPLKHCTESNAELKVHRRHITVTASSEDFVAESTIYLRYPEGHDLTKE
jgi:hypothetical protein